MARMKVYHPETGVAYEGEPIDCREMKQLHGYLSEPPVAATPDAAPEPLPDDLSTLTKTRLQEILTERGVAFETDANKDRLIELVSGKPSGKRK